MTTSPPKTEDEPLYTRAEVDLLLGPLRALIQRLEEQLKLAARRQYGTSSERTGRQPAMPTIGLPRVAGTSGELNRLRVMLGMEQNTPCYFKIKRCKVLKLFELLDSFHAR